MDVTPAGYSLSHCENSFSIKMQSWGLAQKGQLKILLSGALVMADLGATCFTLLPPGKSPTCWVCPASTYTASCLRLTPALSEGKCSGYHAHFTDGQTKVQMVSHCTPSTNSPGKQACVGVIYREGKITHHMCPALHSLHLIGLHIQRSFETRTVVPTCKPSVVSNTSKSEAGMSIKGRASIQVS